MRQRSRKVAPESPPEIARSEERTRNALARIRELKAGYAKKIVPMFYELFSAASSEAEQPNDLDLATRLAHQISGTAGTYGFSNTGQIAGEIEDLLSTLARADDRIRPILRRALEAHLDRAARVLIEELGSMRSELGPD
ncbi:MAG: Hpt domain-containing protein [Deltaproteobacteria bacterium]|nr:Hpt domain-containing protein [Deltaproteobacteria bacterium]